MKAERFEPLVTLIRRRRYTLWRQRLKQSLWYASCATAVTLLLAGLVQITLTPVSPALWLPLALVSPVIAALYTLLWQRPSGADAAAELDRLGGYDELLTSAWEAMAILPARRSAGAKVVLHQAVSLCARIRVAAGSSASSSWQGGYRMLPWSLIAVAIFLLQLPPPQSPQLSGYVSAPGDTYGSDSQWPQLLPEHGPQGALPAAASTLQDKFPGRQQLRSPAQERQPAAANAAVEDQSAAGVDPGNPLPIPSPLPDPDSTAAIEHHPRQAAGSGEQLSPQPRVDTGNKRASAELHTQFEDIARSSSPRPPQQIAGAGGSGFDAATAARIAPRETAAGGIALHPGAVSYRNRFSLPQQLQIGAYFDQLEELP